MYFVVVRCHFRFHRRIDFATITTIAKFKIIRFPTLISHQEHRKINLEIVAANYHYAGFGLGTANTQKNARFIRSNME
jgi:hypothetical protein